MSNYVHILIKTLDNEQNRWFTFGLQRLQTNKKRDVYISPPDVQGLFVLVFKLLRDFWVKQRFILYLNLSTLLTKVFGETEPTFNVEEFIKNLRNSKLLLLS